MCGGTKVLPYQNKGLFRDSINQLIHAAYRTRWRAKKRVLLGGDALRRKNDAQILQSYFG
jgi:hypothetical protein